MSEQHWYSGVVGTLILPLAAIGIVAFIIMNYIFPNANKAIDELAKAIEQVWTEYDKEYKEFMAKGSLTQGEEEILQAKLDLVKGPMQKLADTAAGATDLVYKLGLAVIAAVGIYEVVRHAGDIATNWKKFVNALRDPKNQGAVLAPNNVGKWTYSTPEELGAMFRLSSIMEIADSGNVALASQALSAEQATWASVTIPQMSISAQNLISQMPLFQGMQLVLAQQLLATYNMYLQIYAVTPPPLFWLPPVI